MHLFDNGFTARGAMRQFRQASEHEMIALFLQQELASARFGAGLRGIIEQEQLPIDIVAQPNLASADDNVLRTRVLALHRGYGADGDQYLSSFPASSTTWAWCALSLEETRGIKYINWDYWLALTDGSRSPADAAARIAAGERVYDVSNEGVLAAAAILRAGGQLSHPILVAAGPGEALVILAGHVRMTAYALVPDAVPPEFVALIGVSPQMREWDCY